MSTNQIEKPAQPSHQTEDYSRFNAFLDEFNRESDRAAVILGAARLDENLRQILTAFLLPVTSTGDDLLDVDRPLGTFSARVAMCHRLGLISADLARALTLIRKIRNSFAHELRSSSLETGAHSDRVRELVQPLRRYKQYEELRDLAVKDHKGFSAEFRGVLALVAMRLEGLLNRTASVRPSDTFLVPPHWEEGA